MTELSFCHCVYEREVNNCIRERCFVFAKDMMFVYKKEGEEDRYFCCEVCAKSWEQDKEDEL